MKLFIKSPRTGTDAKAEYIIEDGTFVVLKGTVVSSDVSQSEKFRGANSIIKLREQYVVNGIVIDDVTFSSPSTAANFVTGRSTNGMITWKDESGTKLKDLAR